jgi:16S rRNA (cytosine967-C5)-methyltransferase
LISLAAQAAGAAIVVDLCAGAGGKTLALAADMARTGRLIACDTDRTRLQQLPKRAERAGAEVELRLLNPTREMESLEDLQSQADIVLVDAPCSGSGTWRRNPELRWRLTPERLARTEALQRQVLDIAAQLVKPGGVIVYAVCSLFAREGAEQIEEFMQRHTGFSSEGILSDTGRQSGAGRLLTPFHDATDGFFVARLARSC